LSETRAAAVMPSSPRLVRGAGIVASHLFDHALFFRLDVDRRRLQ
jgi:hypothetical protein